jgi:hypothetical protein
LTSRHRKYQMLQGTLADTAFISRASDIVRWTKLAADAGIPKLGK